MRVLFLEFKPFTKNLSEWYADLMIKWRSSRRRDRCVFLLWPRKVYNNRRGRYEVRMLETVTRVYDIHYSHATGKHTGKYRYLYYGYHGGGYFS